MNQTLTRPAPQSQALSGDYSPVLLSERESTVLSALYERYIEFQEETINAHSAGCMKPGGWESGWRSPEMIIWTFCQREKIPLDTTERIHAVCNAFESVDSSGGDNAFQDSTRSSYAKDRAVSGLTSMLSYAKSHKLPAAAQTAVDDVSDALPDGRIALEDGEKLSRNLSKLLIYTASLQLGKGRAPIGVGSKQAGAVLGCSRVTGGNMLHEARRRGFIRQTSDYVWQGSGDAANRVREYLVDLGRLPKALLHSLSESASLKPLLEIGAGVKGSISRSASATRAWIRTGIERLKAYSGATQGRKRSAAETPSVLSDLKDQVRETRGARGFRGQPWSETSRGRDPDAEPPF